MGTATTIKRRFKITGVNATSFPGPNPAAPVPGIMVTAALADEDPNAAPITPPGGYQWPFRDDDGSIAGTLIVNKLVDVSFAVVSDAPAATGS